MKSRWRIKGRELISSCDNAELVLVLLAFCERKPAAVVYNWLKVPVLIWCAFLPIQKTSDCLSPDRLGVNMGFSSRQTKHFEIYSRSFCFQLVTSKFRWINSAVLAIPG